MAFGDKIQSASGTTSATFGGTPKKGSLIVFFAASTANVTFTAPAGFTGGTAVAASGGAARGSQMSWKVSAGTETGAISPASGSPTNCIMVEYTGPFENPPNDVLGVGGVAEDNVLQVSNTTFQSGVVDIPASSIGQLRLVVCAYAVDATGRTWSNEKVVGLPAVEDIDATWVMFSMAYIVAGTSQFANADVSGTTIEGETAIAVFIPLIFPSVNAPFRLSHHRLSVVSSGSMPGRK